MSDLLKRLDKLAGRLLATTQFGPSAHTVLEAKADIEQSIAYMAGIEADARRYRFLRDEAYNLDGVPYTVTMSDCDAMPIMGAELDRAIDANILAGTPAGSPEYLHPERNGVGHETERAKELCADPGINAVMQRLAESDSRTKSGNSK